MRNSKYYFKYRCDKQQDPGHVTSPFSCLLLLTYGYRYRTGTAGVINRVHSAPVPTMREPSNSTTFTVVEYLQVINVVVGLAMVMTDYRFDSERANNVWSTP
jgi:hypothetical protein